MEGKVGQAGSHAPMVVRAKASPMSQQTTVIFFSTTAILSRKFACTALQPQFEMSKLSLDGFPPEIIGQICSQLLDDDRMSLLSLSTVSKYFRTVSIPIIFQRVWFRMPPPVRKRMGQWPKTLTTTKRDNQMSLLRTMVSNPSIAAHVQDVDFVQHRQHVPTITAEDLEFVTRTATALDVTVPSLLRLGDSDSAFKGNNYLGDDEMQRLAVVDTFCAELILAHLPNIRGLEYNVRFSKEAFCTLFLSSKSGAIQRRPMFPRLEDVQVACTGPANLVQPLAEMAPRLDSLWLENARGPVTGLHFENVRVLLLSTSEFTSQELRDLIRGFPSVKKFWLHQALGGSGPYEQSEGCSPQEAVDALEPLRTQLTELSLDFREWQSNLPAETELSRGLITSLEGFEALEELRIDGQSLWSGNRDLYRDYDAENAQLLVRLLPRSLKKLSLTFLDHWTPFDHDLPVLAANVASCCPELRLIRYQLSYSGPVERRRIEQLRQLRQKFASLGVAFKSVLGLLDKHYGDPNGLSNLEEH